jgi:hypothetical protein
MSLNEIGFLFFGGLKASQNVCKIRDQTRQLKIKTAELKAKYMSLANNIASLDETFKTEYWAKYDEINTLTAQIDVTRDTFKGMLLSMQIGGVLLITFIFLLLVLKQFDLIGPIVEILTWPFRQIINLFKKK